MESIENCRQQRGALHPHLSEHSTVNEGHAKPLAVINDFTSNQHLRQPLKVRIMRFGRPCCVKSIENLRQQRGALHPRLSEHRTLNEGHAKPLAVINDFTSNQHLRQPLKVRMGSLENPPVLWCQETRRIIEATTPALPPCNGCFRGPR